ncbi:MAG: type IV pili methyl-accepting chemotaxis transducer N-terminal domain-containing protein [Pseudomonadales bacterium]|nr:type IV pili methyl-accepting chemotaxis transducer N-terminal domain-containing protein [Pseudomonadales bacterium]
MDFVRCRQVVLFLLAGMLIQTTVASTTSITELEAISQAAWQRTLVMRIAKSHMLVAAGIDYQKSKSQLMDAIEEYEAVLKTLQGNSPNNDISERLRVIKVEWGQFKAASLKASSQEGALVVMEESDDLLYHTDALVRSWKVYTEEKVGHLVDTSSQQSMLSERIGMFYAAHFYGLKNEWVISELNFTLKAYEKGLQELLSYTDNTKEIGDNIARLSNQWEYAKMSLKKFNSGQYLPHVIAVTVDTMMQRSNKIANLYAANKAENTLQYSQIQVPGLASTIGGDFSD